MWDRDTVHRRPSQSVRVLQHVLPLPSELLLTMAMVIRMVAALEHLLSAVLCHRISKDIRFRSGLEFVLTSEQLAEICVRLSCFSSATLNAHAADKQPLNRTVSSARRGSAAVCTAV